MYFLALLVVLIGTPVFGGIFYLAIRPKRTFVDKIPWRESLETQVVPCLHCGEYNLTANRYCIACGEKIKIKCHECGKEFSASYGYCPIC
ncbi:zinc ribbon domain-containing protein [bacterium]|nr:zinc ribbon domain-containing protein [bacterium]